MATSPVPLWAQEMSPYHRGPTAGSVLALAIVVILAVLLLTAGSGASAQAPPTTPPPCAQQWPPTCPKHHR
jgi:hypothetical protein